MRNTLLISLFLLISNSIYATKMDTSCRKIFIDKVMDNRNITNVFFNYLDSSGSLKRKMVSSPYFHNSLIRNKKINIQRIKDLLIKDSVFTFSEFGYIAGNELRDTLLYRKLIKRGPKRYLHRFFRGKIMMHKFMVSSDPDFVAIYGAGYSLGIFIVSAEEKDVAFYISDCK